MHFNHLAIFNMRTKELIYIRFSMTVKHLKILFSFLFIVFTVCLVAQISKEEKEWKQIYLSLHAREIPDVREAHERDAKTIESFLEKYPQNGIALYFLKSELFQLLFWKGSYDTSYTTKYMDALNRYISLPEQTPNGCSNSQLCKMESVYNRGNIYLLMSDTVKACNDFNSFYNFIQSDTSSQALRMKTNTDLQQQIKLCSEIH